MLPYSGALKGAVCSHNKYSYLAMPNTENNWDDWAYKIYVQNRQSVKNMRMKATSYFGIKMEKDNKPIGVMLFESDGKEPILQVAYENFIRSDDINILVITIENALVNWVEMKAVSVKVA